MGKKILIVDDSASVRHVTKLTLVEQGYDVIDACDGQDALQKLEGNRVNLIISDLNMPNLNGLELLSKIKESPNHKFTPFIMLTTESSKEAVQKGQAGGAKAWMVKPFKPDTLLSTVSKLIA